MFRRIAALLLLCGAVARAASPHLSGIDPPGLQRGTDTDVTIAGDRLSDARGLLFYSPGIQLLSLKPLDDKKVTATLRVAPDCPLGEHDIRVWTATGISELMPLFADPFPSIASSGSNRSIAHAQPVPPNTTVTGTIHEEEIDYYSIQANKGDRITAEAEGMRLGREMFDPWAAILDAGGRQLASNDDNPLLMQDPLVSMVAPAAGTYLVAIRESTWGGGNQSVYRLHIGAYPQPTAVYPPGGEAGKELTVGLLGDVKGVMYATLRLPPASSEPFATAISQNGLFAPTPLPMRVSPFPNVLEREPDGDIAHATPAGFPPPVAFNGIIHKPGDRNFFTFHATRGAVLDITVYARQLRSPLDSVLDIWDAKGRHLANNDDSIGPDSYLRFNVPADGDYCLSIRDQLKRGGPTFVYRVEVVPVTPDISFTLPEIVRNSQDRQSVVIPRGNRTAAMLRVKRDDFDDDFRLAMPGLPPGVTTLTGSASGDSMPVVFEAAPDAAVTGTLTDVIAIPADPAKKVTSGYLQTVEILYGDPGNYPYVKSDIRKLALSVADEAPFRVDLMPPVAPILQEGITTLKVTATRDPGFTAPINVSMLYTPPGINAQAVVTIPANQNSADLPINASPDARPRTSQIAVIASANPGHGDVWTSSDMVPLTVSKPFLTGHLDRANTVRGQPVSITCHLTQDMPFNGKAKIRLLGLPDKVTAQDVEVASTDIQAVFNVVTDPTSAVGQHRDLFCEVTVQQGGAAIVARTAAGGVLRIDPPSANQPKKEVALK